MKNIILILIAVAVLSAVLCCIILQEIGTSIQITKVELGPQTKLFCETKPFSNDKDIFLFIQKEKFQLKMKCNYFIKNNKAVINFPASEQFQFLKFLNLNWKSTPEDIKSQLEDYYLVIKEIEA